jgi:hypothetical protein
MIFGLSLRRSPSSSSQARQRGSQYGDFDAAAASHKASLNNQFLAAPPPYVGYAAPEKGEQQTSPVSYIPGAAFMDRYRDPNYLKAPMRKESRENALDTLRLYDTVIIMDDSGSMSQGNRWEQACAALSGLADIASAYDKDGIDIHFLNHPKHATGMTDSGKVDRLFKGIHPQGLTPIAQKLDILVGDYIERLEKASRKKNKGDPLPLQRIKPVNFIVITDGAATDEPLDSIVALARRLDRGNYPLGQVGLQFVQIGDDPNATAFLRQLDDELSNSYGVRDIVDTTPYFGAELTAEMLIKILLGGINRRVDRRGGQAVMNM